MTIPLYRRQTHYKQAYGEVNEKCVPKPRDLITEIRRDVKTLPRSPSSISASSVPPLPKLNTENHALTLSNTGNINNLSGFNSHIPSTSNHVSSPPSGTGPPDTGVQVQLGQRLTAEREVEKENEDDGVLGQCRLGEIGVRRNERGKLEKHCNRCGRWISLGSSKGDMHAFHEHYRSKACDKSMRKMSCALDYQLSDSQHTPGVCRWCFNIWHTTSIGHC